MAKLETILFKNKDRFLKSMALYELGKIKRPTVQWIRELNESKFLQI